ncbi:MAG: protein kinase [Planctomycetota bacterium]|nr:protein kinase [Planctomycetota bacterium]
MVTPVTRNKDQAQWIILKGWLKRSRLELALFDLSKQPHSALDLCDFLVERRELSPAQATQAREESLRRDLPPPSLESTILTQRAVVQRHQDDFLKSLDGQYEILREISRGAMGVIYEAIQRASGLTVALKIMLNRSPDDSEIKRFRQEAAVLIQLKHEHIIDILDFGIEDEQAYFAMDFIEGETLQDAITETLSESSTVPSWAFTVQVMIDIAAALIYCHESQITHRDVKPLNIMIDDKTGHAILIDFGLLKRPTMIDQTQSHGLTLSGEMVGTPAFMSPEQFAPGIDHGEIGPHSDVWGFGATLFYALTGVPPYNKATLIDIYQAIKHQPTPSVRDFNPSLPHWLDTLVQDCLENDSDARPNIYEVKERLEEGYQSTQSSGKFRLWPIAASFLLSLIVGAFVGYSMLDEPIAFVTVDMPESITAKDQTLFKGQLSRGSTVLRINGREIKTARDGSFAISVPLSEGSNTIKAEIIIDTTPVDTHICKVIRDSTPPGIVLFTEFKESEALYILEGSEALTGRIFDDNPAHVQYLGKNYPCDGLGRFSLPLRAGAAPTEHSLSLYDKAGNVTLKVIKTLERGRYINFQRERLAKREFATRKKVVPSLSAPNRTTADQSWRGKVFKKFLGSLKLNQAEQNQLGPILTMEDWRGASRKEQDLAIEVVRSQLEDDFQYLETQNYGSTATLNRIAAFQHRKTGLRLHLIPGHTQRQSWWPDPSTDAQQEILLALADSRSDVAFFKSVASQLSRDIRAKICSELQIESQLEAYFKGLRRRNFDPESFLKAQEQDIEKMMSQFNESPEAFQRLKLSCKNLNDWLPFKSYQTLEYIRPFLLGQSEVSQKAWVRFCDSEAPLPSLKRGQSPDYPAYHLSQEDAKQWLGRLGLRLPKKTEWLYACRGTAKSYYYWRDNKEIATGHCWIRENSGKEVRSVFKSPSGPNSFGLLNMVGNVAEWVEPEWDLWWSRWNLLRKSRGAPESLVPWFALEYRAPLLGGSIDWPLFRFQRKPCYYASINDNDGIWGFRVAASLGK